MKPLTRRDFSAQILGAALAGTVVLFPRASRAEKKSEARLATLKEELAALEKKSGGRLGVAVRDTGDGRSFDHRGHERFPLCSTFKVLACGAVLARVDAGKEHLDRRLRFEAADLVEYSPVTKERTGGEGMTLAEICHAAMTQSDNTAANLILTSLGGPQGVTAFARSLGDEVSRLDRTETALNEAAPGDERDTSSPLAMAANLEKLCLGNDLSPAARQQMIDWLLANKTGDARLRAGVPADWKAGDKTGSGNRGTANDVAIFWPPGRKPVIVCVYLTGGPEGLDQRNALLADAARAVAKAFG